MLPVLSENNTLINKTKTVQTVGHGISPLGLQFNGFNSTVNSVEERELMNWNIGQKKISRVKLDRTKGFLF